MGDLCRLIWFVLVGLFRSRASLRAEIVCLRQQITVLQRRSPKRVALNNIDRLVFTGLYCVAPQALDLCVVPALTFERLFAFLVIGHGRRQLLCFALTWRPMAKWQAQQIVEVFRGTRHRPIWCATMTEPTRRAFVPGPDLVSDLLQWDAYAPGIG